MVCFIPAYHVYTALCIMPSIANKYIHKPGYIYIANGGDVCKTNDKHVNMQ